jgi:plastocyanin
MASYRKFVVLFAVLIAAGSLASFARAGDVKGKVTAQNMRSAENIVVYIDDVPGKVFLPPVQHAILDQMQMVFVPHVLVIVKGTTVNFLNDDPVQHNVYWPAISQDRKLAHNMGTWPEGIVKSFTFSELGTVPLLCKVHSEMSGYIVVVPTPFFAVTDKDGNFTIKDVPPGQYTLRTWSEQAKPATQAVTVTSATDAGAQSACNSTPCSCAATRITNVNLTVMK